MHYLLWWLLLICGPVLAQSPLDTLVPTPATPENQQADTSSKPNVVEQTETIQQEIRDLKQQQAQLPQKITRLEKELSQTIPSLKVDQLSIEQVRQQLEQAQKRLADTMSQRNSLDSDLTKLEEQRVRLPVQMLNIKEKIDQANTSGTLTAEEIDRKVRYWNALLEREQLLLDTTDIRRQWLLLQLQATERTIERTKDNLSRLEQRLQTLRPEEVNLVSPKGTFHIPVLEEALRQSQQLATEQQIAQQNLDKSRLQLIEYDQQYLNLERSFSSIQEKIDRVGLSNAIGFYLREQGQSLPRPWSLNSQLNAIKKNMAHVQLKRMELEDQLIALADARRTAERLLVGASIQAPVSHTAAVRQLTEILKQQRNQYVSNLLKTYDQYFGEVLLPAAQILQQTINVTQRYDQFIAERILWIPSAHPLGLYTALHAWHSLEWLASPEAWLQWLNVSLQRWWHSLIWLLAAGVALAILGFRSRWLAALEKLGQQAGRVSTQFHHTLLALLYSVLIALPWPLLALAGYFATARIGVEQSQSTAQGLWLVWQWLLATEMVRIMLHDHGLWAKHFRWHERVLQPIKTHLPWFTKIVLPLLFLQAAMHAQTVDRYDESLGRLAFIGILITTVLFCWRLFHRQGVFHHYLQSRQGSWGERLQRLWRPLLWLIPLILLIATVWGYYFTSIRLSYLLLISLLWLGAVLVIQGILSRWFYLERRRLALQRFKEQRAQREALENDDLPGAKLITPEEDFKVEELNQQLQRLLFNSALALILIGWFFIWQDVLKVFGILRHVELWSILSVVTDTETGKAIQSALPITLADVGIALIVVIATVVISRNIPGLLEVVVLRRLPFTPSGRYAIITVVRYLLVLLGIVLAFASVGIGWSKVQFLAAAITVGLGFGLQEIFANMVSGLIMLFERQVRVGDVVTIGNTSGRITRIRIRATTIVDWHAKELIIPNREFVTGQVINWSLTSPMLRIDIPVSVAYGSDLTKVLEILNHVANDHKMVMKDPAPWVIFTSFGDSALHFELRFHVESFENGLGVRHDLLLAIDKAFREQDISIPFPQRDLHLRTVPKPEGDTFNHAMR